jgi:N-acetylneuraminic acid mutarotase
MGASLTIHAGQLWLTGGYHFEYVNGVPSYIYSNAVWSSTDGASWAQIDAAAPYSGRSGTSLVDFNNQLWVIGGHDFYSPRNDAWFSSDGANWRVVYSGALVTP